MCIPECSSCALALPTFSQVMSEKAGNTTEGTTPWGDAWDDGLQGPHLPVSTF